ncbi:MAG: alpha/beta hydrolase fold domain-containing protein [Saprospiraceae bacterium]|nr:alpha/beta hydrolase fold domain-containing protein [Saprospiraceae bacterium]
MKTRLPLLLVTCWFIWSCGTNKQKTLIRNENYEVQFAQQQKCVLILFPCFPCDIEHTKREAFFLKDIHQQGVTTVLLNFNQKLYLTETEKDHLFRELQSIFATHPIKSDRVFLGGFSSGGNIALLLADYIAGQRSNLKIKGVFAVDSPVDLEQVYYNAQNDIALQANEGAISEAEMLVQLIENELGTPPSAIDKFNTLSPFLASQKHLGNLYHHQQYKIRLYTEPAPEWQLKNRKRRPENTNSWMFEKLYETLVSQGNNTCELIKTENKGVRANGCVHPHSWSLVEQKTLLEWMK